MKKSLIILLAASLGFAACHNVEPTVPEAVDHAVLSAQIEQDEATKTVLSESNNILWSENDRIVAFMKTSYGHKYQIKPSFAGKTYADFSKVSSANGDDLSAGMEWDHIVAYYPYSEEVECVKSDDGYALEVVLPAEQTYAPESFGNGAFPMVAVSEDHDITFRNVCGGMKLQLKGTQKVASVTVQGKNNEVLSGTATVTAYTDGETKPVITMTATDDASKVVTINCGVDGIRLSEDTATEFFLALPPVVFTEGFTVTVTDVDGNVQTVEANSENEVLRSSLLVMQEVTLEAPEVGPNNPEAQPGDYVDEYGINHRQGIKIGETVWAPVNCGYHATDYKYGKLYQWGRKYGQGYEGGLYDGDWNYVGEYADATTPELIAGPVSASTGQSAENAGSFYYNESDPYDWVDTQNDNLWNSGTEDNPVKTEYDPCPSGWRVPTYAELDELRQNKSAWMTNDEGQTGYWFSGPTAYSEDAPQVFCPAAGYRYYYDGSADLRGGNGGYWSSGPHDVYASYLFFDGGYTDMILSIRACGFSVRCVQE